MTRRTLPFCALTLCAALFCAGLALAAAPPPALEGADIEAAAEAAAKAAAMGSPKDSTSSAQQASELARKIEARESTASKSIEGVLHKDSGQPGSPPPPPPRGSRKTIYGDIIIHK